MNLKKLIEFLLKRRKEELGDGSGDSFIFTTSEVCQDTGLDKDSIVEMLQQMEKSTINIRNSDHSESVIDKFIEESGKIKIYNCTVEKLKDYYQYQYN